MYNLFIFLFNSHLNLNDYKYLKFAKPFGKLQLSFLADNCI